MLRGILFTLDILTFMYMYIYAVTEVHDFNLLYCKLLADGENSDAPASLENVHKCSLIDVQY